MEAIATVEPALSGIHGSHSRAFSENSDSHAQASLLLTAVSSTPRPSSSNQRRRRQRALSSRGALSPDRFIPSSSSFSLFHVDTPPTSDISPRPAPRPRQHPPPPGAVPPPRSTIDAGQIIAGALGIGGATPGSPASGRIFNFQQSRSFLHDETEEEQRAVRRTHFVHDRGVSPADMSLVLAGASARPASRDRESKSPPRKRALKRVLSYAPFRYTFQSVYYKLFVLTVYTIVSLMRLVYETISILIFSLGHLPATI